MRTIKLGIVTVARAAHPAALFGSVLGNTRHDVRWYVHSHAGDAGTEARLAAFCVGNTVDLTLHGRDRGPARSRNDGILQSYADGCDYTLVVEDDVAFLPGAPDRFVEFLANFETLGLAWLYGREADAGADQAVRQDFGCFALGERAFHEVGAFDENLPPAHLGDTDYLVRVRRAGLPIAVDRRVLVERARGHGDEAAPDEAAVAYFERKWGAPEHQEHDAHPLPWDGRFGVRIDWTDRRNPYGVELDRPELLELEPPRPRLRADALPDPRRLATPAPVPEWPARDEGRAHALVRAVFWAILEREPDDGALELYVPLLCRGERSTEDLCSILRTSDEFRSRATR